MLFSPVRSAEIVGRSSVIVGHHAVLADGVLPPGSAFLPEAGLGPAVAADSAGCGTPERWVADELGPQVDVASWTAEATATVGREGQMDQVVELGEVQMTGEVRWLFHAERRDVTRPMR